MQIVITPDNAGDAATSEYLYALMQAVSRSATLAIENKMLRDLNETQAKEFAELKGLQKESKENANDVV